MARRKRSEKKRILICTEGTVTEPQYIDSLKQILGTSGGSVTIRTVGVGRDPVKIVQKCMAVRDKAIDPFDIAVCLIDVDTHAKLKEALALAARNEISVVVSNLKFEVWLLWHAVENVSHFESKQLDRMMSEQKIFEKEKSLSPKFPVENYKRACQIARRADPKLGPGEIGPNSSTGMPWLIDILTSK
ncbi:RloB family protein [Glutamicibacter sp. 363]|uniref:RloB family protein n=1 Tax=unclassified Glutamicibacter TaxID=2627139 RepID=UPI0040334DDD